MAECRIYTIHLEVKFQISSLGNPSFQASLCPYCHSRPHRGCGQISTKPPIVRSTLLVLSHNLSSEGLNLDCECWVSIILTLPSPRNRNNNSRIRRHTQTRQLFSILLHIWDSIDKWFRDQNYKVTGRKLATGAARLAALPIPKEEHQVDEAKYVDKDKSQKILDP